MPVIFASSILTLPQTIGYGLRNIRLLRRPDSARLGWGEPLLYACCLRSASSSSRISTFRIVFDPSELPQLADVRRVHRPGIRPGSAAAADFINEVLTRITLVGALYLIIISFIPEWMITGIHLNHLYGPVGKVLRGCRTDVDRVGRSFSLVERTLLIVVGVAMDISLMRRS